MPFFPLRVKSQIDGRAFDGISSIRLHSGRDYVSDRSNHFIRWTEVFLLSSSTSSAEFDPPDPMSAATHVAKAVCHAMVPNLKKFVEEGKSSLSVRVTLDPEQVGCLPGWPKIRPNA